MIGKLVLQNFRNYSKREFEFNPEVTLIVGPNAAGKTNILEAIYALATGKSFRAENERELIREGERFFRIDGKLLERELGVLGDLGEGGRMTKTYQVNGVGKRQVDFVGNLRAVLFSPLDLEIVVNSPATRRRYLDLVLAQVHKDYRLAAHIYERALRQRNKLLWRIREESSEFGVRSSEMEYWNRLLIENGGVIHQRRKEFLGFLGNVGGLGKTTLPITLHYDNSIISEERLAKYSREEIAAAATLVGPHRDDFVINSRQTTDNKQLRNVKLYGSRGEQRLAVFAMKLGELEYVREATGEDPILLLDDIFSELDQANRHHVLAVIPKQQTIITTTDWHLVGKTRPGNFKVVELGL